MSYSIIEALFRGRLIPWERPYTSTPEQMDLAQKIEQEKKYFEGEMSPDDCRRFQDLEHLLTKAQLDEEVDNYSHGFTLGMLMMMEVMEKKTSMRKT